MNTTVNICDYTKIVPSYLCRETPYGVANNTLFNAHNRLLRYNVLFVPPFNSSPVLYLAGYDAAIRHYGVIWNAGYMPAAYIDDYIIDLDIDTRLYDAASDLVGTVVPTEATITLLNTDNIFDPKNDSSLYSSCLQIGATLLISCECVSSHANFPEQIAPQTYALFVTDICVADDASTVTITARCGVDHILHANLSNSPIACDIQIAMILYSAVRRYAGQSYRYVNDTFIPHYAWFTTDTVDSINQLLGANLASLVAINGAICYITGESMHAGQLFCAALLTDNDQIINIKKNNTLVQAYNSLIIKYYATELEPDACVVDCDITDTYTSNGYNKFSFTSSPIYAIEQATVQTANGILAVAGYTYTPEQIDIVLEAVSEALDSAQLQVYATIVKQTENELPANVYYPSSSPRSAVTATYTYADRFVQDSTAAEYIAKMLLAAINNPQKLSIDIRGNQLLCPGICVYIDSDKYAVHGVYLVIGVHTSYNGALSQTLDLQPAYLTVPGLNMTATDIPLDTATLSKAVYADRKIMPTAMTDMVLTYSVPDGVYVPTVCTTDADPEYVYALRAASNTLMFSRTPWHLTCTADTLKNIVYNWEQDEYNDLSIETLNGAADIVHVYSLQDPGSEVIRMPDITGAAIPLDNYWDNDVPDGVSMYTFVNTSHDLYTVDNILASKGVQYGCPLCAAVDDPACATFNLHVGTAGVRTFISLACVIDAGNLRSIREPDVTPYELVAVLVHLPDAESSVIAHVGERFPILGEADITVEVHLGVSDFGFCTLDRLVLFTYSEK